MHIRTLSLLVILVHVLPGASLAQVNLQVGVARTNVAGSGFAPTEAVYKPAGGVTAALGDVGAVQFRLGAYYAPQGAKRMGGGFPLPQEVRFEQARISVDYLQIPLLARLSSPVLLSRLEGHLTVGPTVSWLLNCKTERLEGAQWNESTQQVEGGQWKTSDCVGRTDWYGSEHVRELEYGAVAAGGIDLELFGPGRGLTIEARYYRAFTSWVEGTLASTPKNESATLLVGYSIGR